ncbi:TetR/AcrR family transcriptional regulator [Priestia endophytica]|uniref:TetR/AcrR family transcriptional regulator n=1 Tax=Priestia endophytica TaxID=135735 RepID=UPI002E1A0F33|nr:TetR/AcrR family transcriptional regulator [Priestia endophytica]
MEKTKLTKRQEQAIQTRNRLYSVMLELMKEKQFVNISIEEISKKAGVSVGTFYHYFKSKEDIQLKLFEQIEEKLFLSLQDLEEKKEIKEEILSFFTQLAKFNSQLDLHVNHFTYMRMEGLTQPPSPIRKQLQTIIEKGQKKKELVNTMNAEEMTSYLFIMALGIIFDWCIHNGDYSIEPVMHRYMSQMLNSVVH